MDSASKQEDGSAKQRLPSASKQEDGSAKQRLAVLVCGHSASRQWLNAASEKLQAVSDRRIECREATEVAPRSLRARARLVQASGAALVLAEARLQRSPILMELINFIHASGLPIAVLLMQSFYEPSGALAAIGTAHDCILSGAGDPASDWASRAASHLMSRAKPVRAAAAAGATDDADEKQLVGVEAASKAGGSGVFLSYQPDGEKAVALVQTSLSTAVRCRPDRRNREAIEACRVFVAIMSPGYEASADSLHDLDFARLRRKEVVPVNAVPKAQKWRPSGWLALAVAGRLYHRLSDEASAAEQHYDSTPLKDFVAAVQAGLQDRPTEEEAEAAEVRALTAEAEACKKELLDLGGTWPPAEKSTAMELSQAFKHLTVEESQPKTQANLPYNLIQYSVTRMSLEPPKPLFDARGVPIVRSFDAMLSYQWASQDLVRTFREQLSVYNVDAWMDIWGGMQGNVNDSMARAVESSRMIVCFFTAKYQQSANCLLELKYAVRRDRPLLFLLVEPSTRPLDWVSELMAKSVVIPFTGMSDAPKLEDGIPRLVRVIETVKKVSAHEALRPRRREDVSEEVYRLERQISAAKDAVHELKGTQRFSTCSRCSVKYDPTSVGSDSCAKHSAYYIGGNIMAGRWVCCSQTDTKAPGCSKAPHISEPRQWATITGGAKKWLPE
ncbi:hypothetical protein BOX15_Mlig033212g1 [Macrostomum lignano]|uniref:TIR domain-containing protein n=1 Tax=Macrostomum lignano TaxID=282301 RepID=A0A267FCY9_9PLAT|nr:hypothetical protein BOX15_Mlig033212g1 [Macrostomum lignano]